MKSTNRLPAPIRVPLCNPTPPVLCPLLKTILNRVRRRLLQVDEAILACSQPGVNGSIGVERLVHERATLVQAIEILAAAPEHALGKHARRQWLALILDTAPACVTAKSRRRIGLLIEGLSD